MSARGSTRRWGSLAVVVAGLPVACDAAHWVAGLPSWPMFLFMAAAMVAAPVGLFVSLVVALVRSRAAAGRALAVVGALAAWFPVGAWTERAVDPPLRDWRLSRLAEASAARGLPRPGDPSHAAITEALGPWCRPLDGMLPFWADCRGPGGERASLLIHGDCESIDRRLAGGWCHLLEQ